MYRRLGEPLPGTPPAFVLSQDQTLIYSLSLHSFLSLTDLFAYV